MQKHIIELRDMLIQNGADEKVVDNLIDATGKLATEIAVKATSNMYITKIKEAAEGGKAEYEAKLKETPDIE